MTYTLILIAVIAVGLFALTAGLISRYKRCPSDKLLVIYGKTNGGSAKVYHGGGAFVWPVVQGYSFLDLQPMALEVDLRGALSKQNIRLDVPSTFTVGISTEPEIMQNAAERLLGMDNTAIHSLAKDMILGQLRLVIATMDIEEINSNREKLLSAVQENVETELYKIGLKLINVNITDIQDESGYIKALGQEAAAKALNDAKTSVAQKNRDGAIGSTEAEKEQRIKTSELHASAEVGEAQAKTNSQIGISAADSKQRNEVAQLNANAVEGENKAAIKIAQTTAERRIAEAEATRASVAAQNVAKAKAEQESYTAQQSAETARADREKATLVADQLVPAEVAKNKLIIEAQAEAEATREKAKGEADAIFLAKEAEAKGMKEILQKQAEGFEKLVQSAGGDPDKAIQLMIADRLPELMRIQVEAIKNIKIDKITVWDSMGSNGNGDGGTTTSNFIKGLLGALPAYDDLYQGVGRKLPNLLNLENVDAEEVKSEGFKSDDAKKKIKDEDKDEMLKS